MVNRVAFRNALEAVHHIQDPEPPWRDVLRTARDLIGADATTLTMFGQGQNLLLFERQGVDDAQDADYRANYYKVDVLAESARSRCVGEWLDTDTLRSDYDKGRHPFYVEFLRKHHVAQIMVFVVLGDHERRAAMGFQRTTLTDGATRSFAQGNVARYMSALADAVSSREHTGRIQLEAVEATINGLGESTLIVSRSGEILRISAHAVELLNQVKMLGPDKRSLTHPRPAVAQSLVDALSRVARFNVRSTIAIPISWGKGVRFDILPTPQIYRLSNETTLFVRFKTLSAFATPSIEETAAYFALTPAEARVLVSLVEGHAPADYASSVGLAERTVRNQIASLMHKMSCNKVSELVRLATALL
ncbi:DNA-binding transcriptional regulator, CsgD family [Paraburkholderia caribensis]|uniref:helix-turn-helix transcriptional regulator n=1 Tax=Paraburkholderia caribensis TaxID=75105 RepID=UPI001CAFD201|nr:helix-turn-helix transcriptional regulator [Paraburkholderia caribensis]CAG9236807.1 DNA-binding transcriptional regulator, CsgD family [Paraburkholderia caribensis]